MFFFTSLREYKNFILDWWIQGDNENRLNFLRNSWNINEFRPFETVESSEQLLQNSDKLVVVRLSTTVPGGITFSFKDINGEILHTRFCVCNNSKIVDSYGALHENVGTLIKWFMEKKYQDRSCEYVITC